MNLYNANIFHYGINMKKLSKMEAPTYVEAHDYVPCLWYTDAHFTPVYTTPHGG